jgi:hypothetical protein
MADWCIPSARAKQSFAWTREPDRDLIHDKEAMNSGKRTMMIVILKRLIILSVCLCLVQSLSFTISSAGPSEARDHLWWAEALLNDITPGSTSYIHNREYNGLAWKGTLNSTARSNTDCSGFMDELFVQTYGFTPAYMKKWLGGKKRPSASSYYGAMVDQRGFNHIKKVYDAKPGDILAVYYPFDRENTGHVMLMAEIPRNIKPGGSVLGGTEQWQVMVIDSSRSPHGREDTRWNANGSHGSGLGKGALRLYTNDTGEITGYTWSLGSKSQYFDRKDRPIAIGRFDIKYHQAGNVK